MCCNIQFHFLKLKVPITFCHPLNRNTVGRKRKYERDSSASEGEKTNQQQNVLQRLWFSCVVSLLMFFSQGFDLFIRLRIGVAWLQRGKFLSYRHLKDVEQWPYDLDVCFSWLVGCLVVLLCFCCYSWLWWSLFICLCNTAALFSNPGPHCFVLYLFISSFYL